MKDFLKGIGITEETVKRAVRTFIQAAVAYLVTVIASGNAFDGEITKTAVIGVVMSAVAAGLSAVMNLHKPTECGAGDGMTFDDWVKKYLGKGSDYDGAYGVQCVDLIKLYVDKVLGITPQSIGNAIEYYNKRKTSAYLKNNFTWISNTPEFIPAKGDIAVFRTNSGLGHVSVCTGEGTTSYFYSYDQNYPSGKHEPMTKIKHTYSSFIGVLRPKDQSNINPKSNKPNVKIGDIITFTANRKCYKGYGSKNYAAYKINELTNFLCDETAKRKKGAAAKVTQIKTLSNGNLWIQYKINSKNVYSCIYEKNADKRFIK